VLPADPPASLRRADGTPAIERHGEARYTTRATLAREATVLEAAARGATARVAMVPVPWVEEVLARFSLGQDQAEAVRRLTTGGERLVCVVGPAGAGKSRSLAAAREAWEAAGYDVVGLAPSAMAAGVLASEAGIASRTMMA